MEHAARRFVTWVLAIHLLLLVVIVTIVLLASRSVYDSAREQGKNQARTRQELLASQTARGIERFYASILDNLDFHRRAQENDLQIGGLLWDRLRGRASHLLTVDRDALKILRNYTDNPQIDAAALVSAAGDWLRALETGDVSSAYDVGNAARVNLVAVPVKKQGTLLVAVIPMRTIQGQFLGDVNNEQGMLAMLLDENATVMVDPDGSLVGRNILQSSDDPRMSELARKYIRDGKRGTELFEEPLRINDDPREPAMATIQPIDVAGKKWLLVISSGLAEVDAVVSTLFRRAMFWAIFVIVSVTAVLISTSVQLIRGRVRLERVRHEMLTRELSQAREIQLAWLPDHAMRPNSIDIAAVNEPASHISGDFYNWFELPDGRTVVAIGDVTGHGMAAAFLMATTQLLVRTTMMRVGDPGPCLEEMNRTLCMQATNGQFVTMLILVIDVEQGFVDVATAGHHPPLVGEGAGFEPLKMQSQLVLGVDDDVQYPTERFAMSPGSSFLLYTDGVTDVVAPSGERFSDQRLRESLHGRFNDAQTIINATVEALNTFRRDRELADDLTLVAIQLQSADVSKPSTRATAAV
jgi:serine phosphatase RsbU (regulator of sigma subunit)